MLKASALKKKKYKRIADGFRNALGSEGEEEWSVVDDRSINKKRLFEESEEEDVNEKKVSGIDEKRIGLQNDHIKEAIVRRDKLQLGNAVTPMKDSTVPESNSWAQDYASSVARRQMQYRKSSKGNLNDDFSATSGAEFSNTGMDDIGDRQNVIEKNKNYGRRMLQDNSNILGEVMDSIEECGNHVHKHGITSHVFEELLRIHYSLVKKHIICQVTDFQCMNQVLDLVSAARNKDTSEFAVKYQMVMFGLFIRFFTDVDPGTGERMVSKFVTQATNRVTSNSTIDNNASGSIYDRVEVGGFVPGFSTSESIHEAQVSSENLYRRMLHAERDVKDCMRLNQVASDYRGSSQTNAMLYRKPRYFHCENLMQWERSPWKETFEIAPPEYCPMCRKGRVVCFRCGFRNQKGNAGRYFYKCDNYAPGVDKSCSYFIFVDEYEKIERRGVMEVSAQSSVPFDRFNRSIGADFLAGRSHSGRNNERDGMLGRLHRY